MSPEQQKQQVDKVMKLALEESYLPESAQSHTTCTSRTLSTEWNVANISYSQPSHIVDLWRKGEEILNTPGYVCPAAGNVFARQVGTCSVSGATSNKGVTPPHFVHSKKNQELVMKYVVIVLFFEVLLMCATLISSC